MNRKSLLLLLVFAFTLLAQRVDLNEGIIFPLDDPFDTTSYTQGKLPIDEQGVYRFKSTFTLPATLGQPALYLGAMYYPCKIYVNDYELYRWGKFAPGEGMTNYSAVKVSIPPQLLKKKNTLIVEFWTDKTTMAIADRWIGEDPQVTAAVESYNSINNTGIKIGVILAFFAFVISMAAFLVNKKRPMDLLYFSLFALTTALTFHMFVFNSVLIDHILQVKLFRTTTPIMATALFWLVSELTGKLRNRKIHGFLLLILVPAVFLIWSADSKYAVEEVIKKVVPLYVAPVMILSFSLVIVSLFKERTKTLIILGINFIFIFYGTYNDLASVSRKILPDVWLLPYSYVVIVISISVIMVHIQVMLQKENERNGVEMLHLNSKLEGINTELEEAKKALELENAARESFIKTVSHELRTPLTALIGGVDIVSSDPNVPPHLQKPLFYIKGAFHRLVVTVSNLFDFVAMKQDGITIVPHPFSVVELIDPVLSFYKDTARSKGISLIIIPPKNVPDMLYGDSEHLIQIIDNLIGNAVKFTDGGGVSCKMEYHQSYLQIDIQDTGTGIGDEKQDAMFKAFSRGEDFSFSQRYEGIGLGLAIVDATVRAMKGTLTFKSTKGQGTLFSVTIPMLPALRRHESLHWGKRVLVVEDNSVNSLMMVKQLEKMNFHCDTAFNGEEAVEQCRKNRYDIILMDVQMPVMDGLTATLHIRKTNTTVPIVAVTANGNVSECIQSGMNAVLMKPVSQEKLIAVVTEQMTS